MKLPISNLLLSNYLELRSSWLRWGACVLIILTGFLFQEHVQSALELTLTFTKNRSKKRQTSCLCQPPSCTEMHPKIEKVLKDHAIITGIMKDKQKEQREGIISENFLLKNILGRITGKVPKHPLIPRQSHEGRSRRPKTTLIPSQENTGLLSNSEVL